MRDRKERAHGPYQHGRRFRVVIVGANGRKRYRSFEEEGLARAYVATFQTQTDSRTVKVAVDAFIVHHKERGLRFTTTTRMEYHLRKLLQLDRFGGKPLRTMKPARGAELYAAMQKVAAVDTHRGALAVGRAWGRWCVKQGWIKVSPFAEVEGQGRRKKGKPQPRVDEARTLIGKLLEIGPRDQGAVATMVAMVLGMRATEIASRDVRDVDDGGRLLWIPDSKTDAGKRTLEVPVFLRPLLLALASKRMPHEPLFRMLDGTRPTRHWLYHHVKRLCGTAKIPKVSPHGLRGLHATLARVGGSTSAVVAAQLGHADEQVQTAYVDPVVAEAERRRQSFAVLVGGKV